MREILSLTDKLKNCSTGGREAQLQLEVDNLRSDSTMKDCTILNNALRKQLISKGIKPVTIWSTRDYFEIDQEIKRAQTFLKDNQHLYDKQNRTEAEHAIVAKMDADGDLLSELMELQPQTTHGRYLKQQEIERRKEVLSPYRKLFREFYLSKVPNGSSWGFNDIDGTEKQKKYIWKMVGHLQLLQMTKNDICKLHLTELKRRINVGADRALGVALAFHLPVSAKDEERDAFLKEVQNKWITNKLVDVLSKRPEPKIELEDLNSVWNPQRKTSVVSTEQQPVQRPPPPSFLGQITNTDTPKKTPVRMPPPPSFLDQITNTSPTSDTSKRTRVQNSFLRDIMAKKQGEDMNVNVPERVYPKQTAVPKRVKNINMSELISKLPARIE